MLRTSVDGASRDAQVTEPWPPGILLAWPGPAAGHRKAPVDWLPGLQVLPLEAFLFLRATAAAGSTSGGHGGEAPPAQPCHGASWTHCPRLCRCFQPRVDTAAARDIFSPWGGKQLLCELQGDVGGKAGGANTSLGI